MTWTKIKAWWSGLPTWIQTTLIAFGTPFVGVILPMIVGWASGTTELQLTWAFWSPILLSCLKAGILAVISHWIPSNFGKGGNPYLPPKP